MSLDDRAALHHLLNRMTEDEKLALIGEIAANLRVRPGTRTDEEVVTAQKAAREELMRKLEALPAPDPDRHVSVNEHDQLIYGR